MLRNLRHEKGGTPCEIPPFVKEKFFLVSESELTFGELITLTSTGLTGLFTFLHARIAS